MTTKPPISLKRRDQFLILSSLSLLAGLAWVYLLGLDAGMVIMGGSTEAMGTTMGIKPWTPADFAMMFLMWAIMMVGMMVPSAMRAVMIFAGIARKAADNGRSFASANFFIAGYIVIWSGFSAVATLLQWGLEHFSLLSPMMVLLSPQLGAALLFAAGLYQISPLKDVCLRHCQSPAHFIAQHFKGGNASAFNLGIKHGLYCLGCCWVLMGLLFVGGVMNLVWILAITLFVLIEKLLPQRLQIARVSGGLMIATALVFIMAEYFPYRFLGL